MCVRTYRAFILFDANAQLGMEDENFCLMVKLSLQMATFKTCPGCPILAGIAAFNKWMNELIS